jgi:hypothetical protein
VFPNAGIRVTYGRALSQVVPRNCAHNGGHSDSNGQNGNHADAAAQIKADSTKLPGMGRPMGKPQRIGQQAEDKDNCVGNRRNTEIEQEVAAVHLCRTIEDLTEAGRTKFCTHAATLACRFPVRAGYLFRRRIVPHGPKYSRSERPHRQLRAIVM